MQDEHALGSPLRAPCKATRPPEDLWGAGAAPRSTGAGDCSARASPVRHACGASSARHAVPGGTRHLWMVVLRRDATRASGHGTIVARLYATHNPGFVPNNNSATPFVSFDVPPSCYWLHDAVVSPSLHHSVHLSFPCWDNSRHRCYTLRQAGGEWAARHPPACTKLQRRRPTIDIAVAQQLLRE